MLQAKEVHTLHKISHLIQSATSSATASLRHAESVVHTSLQHGQTESGRSNASKCTTVQTADICAIFAQTTISLEQVTGESSLIKAAGLFLALIFRCTDSVDSQLLQNATQSLVRASQCLCLAYGAEKIDQSSAHVAEKLWRNVERMRKAVGSILSADSFFTLAKPLKDPVIALAEGVVQLLGDVLSAVCSIYLV